jgi:hypothetical protein
MDFDEFFSLAVKVWQLHQYWIGQWMMLPFGCVGMDMDSTLICCVIFIVSMGKHYFS